jgi:5-(carboxyamino)imidazole ribonucleotide synthase
MNVPSIGPNRSAPCALGVLGGGQLGRFFVQAAQRLGYHITVLDPQDNCPAAQVNPHVLTAPYDDPKAWNRLAAHCQAVTTEFENVPAQALQALAEQGCRVCPPAWALEVAQNRLLEKKHFLDCGIPCGPFHAIETENDLSMPELNTLLPGILKTAQLGYDGRGQQTVHRIDDLKAVWQNLGSGPAILERRLALSAEYSVILARSDQGICVCLPIQRNVHHQGILAVTQVFDAQVAPALAQALRQATQTIATSLNYVGVLCVEFFVLEDGSWVANEMAPRPHNSGHYSLDACDLSQFDLQLRTLVGLPLLVPRLHSPALMLNILGDAWFTDPSQTHPQEPLWNDALALPGVHLYLYGKTAPRPGRKMGHLTITASNPVLAYEVAVEAANRLGLQSARWALDQLGKPPEATP